jgi:hypothetical protein
VRLITGTLAALLLAGCGGNSYNLIGHEVRQVEVVSHKPPKRFYVTLKDVQNGHVEEVYVAKRCWGFEDKVKPGMRFMTRVDIYRISNEKNETVGESMEFNSRQLSDYFCS